MTTFARRGHEALVACTVIASPILVACGPSTGSSPQGSGEGSGGSTSAGSSTGSSATGDTTGSSGAVDSTSESTGAAPAICAPAFGTFQPITPFCLAGTPLQQHGEAGPSGLALCPDGTIHSYGIACCGDDVTIECPGPPGMCELDDECTERERGACRSYGDFCVCTYDNCVIDADCSADEACICASGDGTEGLTHAVCVQASCRTDADCGGLPCGLSHPNCAAPYELRCRTPDDECQSDADCDGGGVGCGWNDAVGHWSCQDAPPCD